MQRCMWILATLVATLALGAAAAAASGGIELAPSEGELGRLRATGRVTFSTPEGGLSVPCELQLGISLNRTISKVPGGPAGLVTEASNRSCGLATLAEGLPWSLNYVAYSGTLPSITSVRLQLVGLAFLGEIIGSRCLFRGEMQFTTGGIPISELRIDESISVPLWRSLSGACLEEWTPRGTLALAPTVRMTLIGRARACGTPPAVRVDEAFQRQEASNATIGMTLQIECESTRVESIRTTRANESVGIAERERAVGRIFRRGERFRYELRLTAREGTRVVEEGVEIAWTEEGGASRGTTRVRFTDL